MASCTDLTMQNFVYRIGVINPQTGFNRRRFRYNPRPTTTDPDTSAGMVRSFAVYFAGSESANEVQDVAERVDDSTWVVEVAYPVDSARGDEDLQRLILQDRHEIHKTLRDTRNYTGVSTASPSAATGLHRREFVDDEIDRESPVTWYYRSRWGCTIFESEA